MDLAALELLLSPLGQAALLAAGELAPRETEFLSCFKRLSKQFPADVARAALQQVLWRQRAASKFSRAESMYFEREALEQASGEIIATHRAGRLARFGRVADLCCGLGGDAIALAGRTEVLAVDRDPLRLRLAALNLQAYGLSQRVRLVQGDVLQVDLSGVEAAFADPDRRVDGRRVLSAEQSEPTRSALQSRFPPDFPLGIKLAPGLPRGEVDRLTGEVEFLSVAGELKECVQWTGSLAGPRRRATLLPAGHTLWATEVPPCPAVEPPGDWLLDPDPAVVRAGLVGELAQRVDGRLLDPTIAYLSTRQHIETPFAQSLAIEESLPFHLGRLRELLRKRGVGTVEIRRRGSAVEPETLWRQLRLRGSERRIIVLTQVQAQPWVLVCGSSESRSIPAEIES